MTKQIQARIVANKTYDLNYLNLKALLKFVVAKNPAIKQILQDFGFNEVPLDISLIKSTFDKYKKVIYINLKELGNWKKLCKVTIKELWDLLRLDPNQLKDSLQGLNHEQYLDLWINAIIEYKYNFNLINDQSKKQLNHHKSPTKIKKVPSGISMEQVLHKVYLNSAQVYDLPAKEITTFVINNHAYLQVKNATDLLKDALNYLDSMLGQTFINKLGQADVKISMNPDIFMKPILIGKSGYYIEGSYRSKVMVQKIIGMLKYFNIPLNKCFFTIKNY